MHRCAPPPSVRCTKTKRPDLLHPCCPRCASTPPVGECLLLAVGLFAPCRDGLPNWALTGRFSFKAPKVPLAAPAPPEAACLPASSCFLAPLPKPPACPRMGGFRVTARSYPCNPKFSLTLN